MTLYIDGNAHIPERFWSVSTEQKTDNGLDRPTIDLNKLEKQRYEFIVSNNIRPILGDILIKYKPLIVSHQTGELS